MDKTTLIIAAIVFGFAGLSRQIQAASGVKPKPMPKKDRWTLYAIILFCVICYIAGLILDAISKGLIDPKSLF